jgi:putative ABC transport system permease protein
MKYLYFVWKNLGRRKVRTTLTILSILVAFILYGLLGSIKQAFTLGVEIAGANRLVVIHKISLIQPLPESYVGRIATVEGVRLVTHATWFGGYYQDPKNQFGQFPVDADTWFEVYPELIMPEEQLQNWRRNRVGAVVGESLAKRFGWKVGDRLPLIGTIYPHDGGSFHWEFAIEGIFSAADKRADTSYMAFHYDYFDEAKDWGKGQIGWIVFTVDDPARAAETAMRIDEMFANSPAETRTSTEKAFVESFAKQFGDIGLIVSLILTAVFFTMLLVSGNTMAQSVRERIPELAVLKTIGFGDVTMLALVLAESLLIAGIGAVFGMGVAWLAIQGIAAAVSAYLPGLAFTPVMFAQGLGLAVAFGVLTGLLPAVQAMQLSIVNALTRH